MQTERDNIIHILHKSMTMKVLERSDDVDIIETPHLCRKLVSCIGHIDYDFQSINHPFVFKISIVPSSVKTFVLDAASLAQFLRDNCTPNSNIVEIDYFGHFISLGSEYVSSLTEANRYSEKNSDFIFYVYGRQIHVIINGVGVDYVPNASSRQPIALGTEFHIDEWIKLIERYKIELKAQKRLSYWATPKPQMKLMDSPEALFRKDLANFIEQHTIGCIVDQEAFSGDDRTDIRVITREERGIYFFELKCLGVCKSGTTYGDDHAHEALVQINIYIKKEPTSVSGIVVIFDGRQKKTTIQWPKEIVAQLDDKVQRPPTEIHLETESASTTAKKTVASLKKKR